MDYTELLVGDLVEVNGKPTKITSDDLRKMFLSDGVGYKISPIRITPEFMKKNGFQQPNDGEFLLMPQIVIEVGTKFAEVSATYEEFDTYSGFSNDRYIEIAIIHNVHELQHLLRVVGVKREIQL